MNSNYKTSNTVCFLYGLNIAKLIDAKGINVTQPIWPSGCSIFDLSYFREVG